MMTHFVLIFTVCLLGITFVFISNSKSIEKKTETYILPMGGAIFSGIANMPMRFKFLVGHLICEKNVQKAVLYLVGYAVLMRYTTLFINVESVI